MHPVSCTNTHHDVTDLLNHGMAENTKTWISQERNITFYETKNVSICASGSTFWEVIVLQQRWSLNILRTKRAFKMKKNASCYF